MKSPRCQHDNPPGGTSPVGRGALLATPCPACVACTPPARNACTRRRLLALSAALLAGLLAAAWPLAATAQRRVYRVGWLLQTGPEDPIIPRAAEAIRQGLREQGWVEASDVTLEQFHDLDIAPMRYQLRGFGVCRFRLGAGAEQYHSQHY